MLVLISLYSNKLGEQTIWCIATHVSLYIALSVKLC